MATPPASPTSAPASSPASPTLAPASSPPVTITLPPLELEPPLPELSLPPVASSAPVVPPVVSTSSSSSTASVGTTSIAPVATTTTVVTTTSTATTGTTGTSTLTTTQVAAMLPPSTISTFGVGNVPGAGDGGMNGGDIPTDYSPYYVEDFTSELPEAKKYVRDLYNNISTKKKDDIQYWNRILRLNMQCAQKLTLALQFPPPEEQLFTKLVKDITVSYDGLRFYRGQTQTEDKETKNLSDNQKIEIRSERCNALVVLTSEPCRINNAENSEGVQITGLPAGSHSEILFILERKKGNATLLLDFLTNNFLVEESILAEVGKYWSFYFEKRGFTALTPTSGGVSTSNLVYFLRSPSVTLTQVKTSPPNSDPLIFDADDTVEGDVKTEDTIVFTGPHDVKNAERDFLDDVNTIQEWADKNSKNELTSDAIKGLQNIHVELYNHAKSHITAASWSALGSVEQTLQKLNVQPVYSLLADIEKFNHSAAPDRMVLAAIRGYLDARNGHVDEALKAFLAAEKKWRAGMSTDLLVESDLFIWNNFSKLDDVKHLTLNTFDNAERFHNRLIKLRKEVQNEISLANSARAQKKIEAEKLAIDNDIQEIRKSLHELNSAFRTKIEEFLKTSTTNREILNQWRMEAIQYGLDQKLWPIVSKSTNNVATKLETTIIPGPKASVPELTKEKIDETFAKLKEEEKKFYDEKVKKENDKKIEIRGKISTNYAYADQKHQEIVQLKKDIKELGQAESIRNLSAQATECYHAAVGAATESLGENRTSSELATVRDILELNNNCLERYLAVFKKEKEDAAVRKQTLDKTNYSQKVEKIRELYEFVKQPIDEARDYISKPGFYDPNDGAKNQVKAMEATREKINHMYQTMAMRKPTNNDATNALMLKEAEAAEKGAELLRDQIIQTSLQITTQMQDDLSSVMLMQQLRASQTYVENAQNMALQSSTLAEAHRRAVELAEKAQAELLRRSQFQASELRTVGISLANIDQVEKNRIEAKRLEYRVLIEQLDDSVQRDNELQDASSLLQNLEKFENEIQPLILRTNRMQDLQEQSSIVKKKAQELIVRTRYPRKTRFGPPLNVQPQRAISDDEEEEGEGDEEEDQEEEVDDEVYREAIEALRDGIERSYISRDVSELETLLDDVAEAEFALNYRTPEASRYWRQAQKLLGRETK